MVRSISRVNLPSLPTSGAKSPEEVSDLEARIRKWLDRHRFSYHSIWTESAKPPAQAYIDDHGVYCCPAKEGITAFKTAQLATRALCKL